MGLGEDKISLIESAFEKYGARLYRAAYLLLGSREDAEDLCQNAFHQMARSIDRFEGRSSLFTWVYRIMLNLYYKELRRRDRTDDVRSGVAVEDLAAEPVAAQHEESVTAEDALKRTIHLLPKIYQSVLILRYYQNLSYEQMAEVLDCPLGTVRSRLYAAKEDLRKRLKEVLPHEL